MPGLLFRGAMMGFLNITERIREFRLKKQARARFLAVKQETVHNVERYHVMAQQDTRYPFPVSLAGETQIFSGAVRKTWLDNVARIQRYNVILNEYHSFRQWYSGDVSRQSRDNAKILDDKKDQVDSCFQGLGAVLETMQKCLTEITG